MRKYQLIPFLIFLSNFIFGFDFPAPNGKILTTFAQDNHGQFNTGYKIQGTAVYASEKGEIVYCSSKMIAIQHSDKIMTIYTGVDAHECSEHGNFVRKGQLLGTAVSDSFHFDILDTEMKRYINPSLMINSVKKSELPSVLGIEYDRMHKILEVKLNNEDADRLYSIQVLLDGSLICDLRFDTISIENGELKLDNTGFVYAELYRKNGVLSFARMPFKSGDNPVEVIVRDFYGKTISFRSSISI